MTNSDRNINIRTLLCVLAPSAFILFGQPVFAQDVSKLDRSQTIFDLGLSIERFNVGEVRFGGKYDFNSNPAPLVSSNEQQDGHLNGARVDALLSTPGRLFGLNGIMNFRGFYFRSRADKCRFVTLHP